MSSQIRALCCRLSPFFHSLSARSENATLTIFVQPATKGSSVTIMTKGLKWDGKGAEDDEDGDE